MLIDFLFFMLMLSTFGLAWGTEEIKACQRVSNGENNVIFLDKPGKYCLDGNIYWNKIGPAIRISSSRVEFNLMGYKISGNPELTDQIAVLVEEGEEGVTIENGRIDFVQIGILAPKANKLKIDGIKFAYISWFGVQVNGSGNSVLNSIFSDLGDSSSRGPDTEAYSVGILTSGDAMLIKGNDFHGVYRRPVDRSIVGEGVAILIQEGSSDFSIVSNTFFSTVEKSDSTIGVWARVRNVIFEGNDFRNLKHPISGEYQGRSYLSNNKFQPLLRTKRIKKRTSMSRAVAMLVQSSDEVFFKGNFFDGYSCPIQISTTSDEQLNLRSEANEVVWPKSGRFCEGRDQVWFLKIISIPKISKIAPVRP